ncbi:hypothetical protein R1T16_13375 [Flavobacterium sp. DG1-102-2]|uniref:hypothetical protein n=1 Tax=Flavobacterium sp. DG1-102-2 TaxID=3081663 RepID=UPI00294A38E5|nr:hypothetical protein [Flavobacterium sp. DG1-102-2]MDV6169420.1 hypothetical protein [Flavobacterium sp. DG1-102-2]
MSKSTEYNLRFYKTNVDGKIYNICSHHGTVDSKSNLIFLTHLDYDDTMSFLNDLQLSVNSESNADEGFDSSSIEHISIKYEYPNVNIDDILILPMIDFIELLTEWKNFINS